MKPQNFRDCGGPWHLQHLQHLGFFTNHLKLVNSIPDIYLINCIILSHKVTVNLVTMIDLLEITYCNEVKWLLISFNRERRNK